MKTQRVRDETECYRCGAHFSEADFVERCVPNFELTYIYSMATEKILPDHSIDMRHCPQCDGPVSMLVAWGTK